MRHRIAEIWHAALDAGKRSFGRLTGRESARRSRKRAKRSSVGDVDRGGARDGSPRSRRQSWRSQARALGAEVIPLSGIATGSMRIVGKHHEVDLSRYAYVLTRVKGSLLDVGCGHGIFLDAYDRGDKAGVDIQARGEHDWPFHLADAAELPFPDASWDTVSAQEMLEHLPDEKLELVLAELRRVMRQRLLVTVPFLERRLKSGHVQRFDAGRVRTMFPSARYTVLDKGDGSYPWVLIEEAAAPGR